MAYVLIVDDNKDFATAVTVALEGSGHEVAVELDTQSGLKSMEARCPDLLLLDVIFPKDDFAGFELARVLRERFKNPPVLMLTAVNEKFPYGFSEKDIDNRFLPVSDFMEKPVDMDILCRKVVELLNQSDHDRFCQ